MIYGIIAPMKKILSGFILFFAGFFSVVFASTLQISVQDPLTEKEISDEDLTITLSGNSARDIEYNMKQSVRLWRMVISMNLSPSLVNRLVYDGRCYI